MATFTLQFNLQLGVQNSSRGTKHLNPHKSVLFWGCQWWSTGCLRRVNYEKDQTDWDSKNNKLSVKISLGERCMFSQPNSKKREKGFEGKQLPGARGWAQAEGPQHSLDGLSSWQAPDKIIPLKSSSIPPHYAFRICFDVTPSALF